MNESAIYYSVFDYFQNPFGKRVYVNKDLRECEKFADEYKKEFGGSCKLLIKGEIYISFPDDIV